MTDELSQDRKKAIHYILHYGEERQAYINAKAAAMAKPTDDNKGRSGAVSKPTESAAIASIQYDAQSNIYPWLKAVDALERGLSERKKLLLELRRDAEYSGRIFRRGRRAWVIYVQRRYIEMIEERYGKQRYIGERTIRDWWYEMIDRVVDSHLRIENKMLKIKKF